MNIHFMYSQWHGFMDVVLNCNPSDVNMRHYPAPPWLRMLISLCDTAFEFFSIYLMEKMGHSFWKFLKCM